MAQKLTDKDETLSEVNVIPLADLSLVLLIILMVMSPMISQALIQITAAGIETLRQVRADRAGVIDPHIASLDDDDRQTLAAAVRVLQRLLDDAATKPICSHRRTDK